MQPGETITPGSLPDPEQQPEITEAQTQPPVEPVQQAAPTTLEPIPPAPEPAPTWQFTSTDDNTNSYDTQPEINPVSWTASEYIAHDKNPAWFMALGLIVFAAAVGIYFVADIVTAIAVATAGIVFGVFAARPPRVLQYMVDTHGIRIGDKTYAYSDFRSFDISDDSPLPAILLMPLKRFLPPITVFYDQNDEDAIINVLASYLPHEEQRPDAVDRLMRRIRF